MMRRLVPFFASVLLGCQPGPTWKSVREMIQRDFPDVPNVGTAELQSLLDAESGARPVLLDVREEKEYAVSHLPGARRVPPGEVPDFLLAMDPETPIVAYCSVGYRSSQLVEMLRERGFDRARNLEGSIFAWANEGRPLERDGEPVREVHPYDESWGRLLDEELRAYEPGGR